MTRSKARLLAATMLAALTLGTSIAEAAGILTIGRREDSTTFDPIASPTVEVGPTREPQFVHGDQVTEATFTFVAIDDEGRPRAIAPI